MDEIREMAVRTEIARMKLIPPDRFAGEADKIEGMIEDEATKLREGGTS